LLHGDLDEAEPEIVTAMQQAEQRGDLSLLSRCLTYLSILYRKRGNPGQVIQLASRALKTAEAAQMPEYAGAAHANLAWVHWRTGDFSRTREHCQTALSMWNQSPGVQAAATPYYWTAIWPLIGMALAEGKLAEATEHVRDLLQPHRKRFSQPLTAALAKVLDAWENGQDVRASLDAAVALAEDLHEV
jgi:tetratricopeptide (TPR) repeat protein